MGGLTDRHAEKLSRNQRIAHRRVFLQAYSQGTKTHTRCSVIFMLPNSFGHPRLGITVTKKVGNAVVRNRIKRRVREIYRRSLRKQLPEDASVDLVINMKRAAVDADYMELETDLVAGLRNARKRAARVGG